MKALALQFKAARAIDLIHEEKKTRLRALVSDFPRCCAFCPSTNVVMMAAEEPAVFHCNSCGIAFTHEPGWNR